MDDRALQSLKHAATIAMAAARDATNSAMQTVAEGAYFKAHAGMMASVSAEEVMRLQSAFETGMRDLRSAIYAAGR
jgi:hypothetical protein